jgi:hypothetical protein
MKLSDEEVRAFVYEDHPLFEHVEEVVDLESMYKDYCPATTISKKIGTEEYWAIDWDSYMSHYGSGEHMFHDNNLYRVEQVEKVTVTKEWKRITNDTKAISTK